MRKSKHPRQTNPDTKALAGFTIIELLIASLVFSIVLVGVMAAFIQISRVFYKGINMSNTQNSTRTITQDIENDIQFGSGVVHAPTTGDNYLTTASNNPAFTNYFCVGDHRYIYQFGFQVGDPAHPHAGIFREPLTTTSCPKISGSGSGYQAPNYSAAEQLLGTGMQLNSILVDCTSQAIRCDINVHVVFYGGGGNGLFGSAKYASQFPNNLWQAPDAECTGALTSSQYCATADYNRAVLQSI